MMDNKYGYCKAIDKKTRKTVEGYFAVIPFCTYCFKEDYEAHPDNDRECVTHWEPGDWGLPNTPRITEIVPGSAKRYIGEDKHGRKVFEDDFVHFDLDDDFVLGVTVYAFYGNWKPQVKKVDDETFIKTMWNKERFVVVRR